MLGPLLATRILLELSATIAIEAGLVTVSSRTRYRPSRYGWSGHPDFGVWRRPDAEFRRRSSCVDVRYRSNSLPWGHATSSGAGWGTPRAWSSDPDRARARGGRPPLVVVLIPVLENFRRQQLSGANPLTRRLEELGARVGGVQVVDLLPLRGDPPGQRRRYFQACDTTGTPPETGSRSSASGRSSRGSIGPLRTATRSRTRADADAGRCVLPPVAPPYNPSPWQPLPRRCASAGSMAPSGT